MCIHKHAAFPQDSPTRFLRVSLATSELQESPNNSFSFDSDGLPFVIDNSVTCIICNDRAQFIGNLRAEKLSVETTHGSASTNYVGTISLTLTTDDGEKLQYHIPDAIYNPNSPFNILGIPFFGRFLGRGDLPCPTSDDDGTYVQSSATRSRLVWDHGKYKRHFTHDDRCLPILQLNTGFSYYQAFCSQVIRAYDNVVHYAFLASHSILLDGIETLQHPTEGAPHPVTSDTDLFWDKKFFILMVKVLKKEWSTRELRRMVNGIPFAEAIHLSWSLPVAIFSS